MAADDTGIEVTVAGVFEQEITLQDEVQRVPIIALQDPVGRELRLPVSSCEALAVQIALEQHVVARPLTHDLGVRLIERLNARLTHVQIDAVSAYESHATLYLLADGESLLMDARPGDAVALAMRAEVPILVCEELLTIRD